MGDERAGRGELIVLWCDGDVFSGEEEPPTLVDWPWSFEAAFAVDAFGEPQRPAHPDASRAAVA